MDASTRKTPKIEAPSAERIPPEMLGEDRWILWTYWRDKNGTLKKPPVDVVTGRHCSGTDRANWMSWAEAQEAARKSGGKWGVGFALGAGWSGIDLDDCIVEIDGKQRLAEWSERIVKPNGEIQSYAEISPSGTGVKIFVRDPLEASKTHSPDGACCIETYGKDRYFATTGRRMKGAPEEVREAPETVSATLLQAVAWKNQSEGRKAERAKQAGQGNTAAPSGGDRAEERMAAKKATTPVRVDDDDLLIDDPMPTGGGCDVKEQAGSPPKAGDLAVLGPSSPDRRSTKVRRLADAARSDDWAEGAGEGPVHLINAIALAPAMLARWVPALFPTAQKRGGGAWQIPAADIGIDSTDNLQISPLGIRNFGLKGEDDGGARTPIDLVLEYGDAKSAREAAHWLMDQCGLGPRMTASLATVYRRAEVETKEPDDIFAPARPVGLEPVWPAGTLPAALDAYCVSIAKEVGGDPDLARGLALLTLGACLPAGVSFRPKATRWEVPAAFFVGIVGYSGAAKSPVLKPLFRPLEKLEEGRLKEHAAKYATYNRRLEAWKSRPPKTRGPAPREPVRKRQRLLTHATTEGVAKQAERTQDGVVMKVEELKRFYGSFDRYAGKGSFGGSDRSFWVEAYDGGFSAKGLADESKNLLAPRVLASVFGGIQPPELSQILAALGTDGLCQRTIWLKATRRVLTSDDAGDEEGAELYAQALRRIVDCNWDDFVGAACRMTLTASAGAKAVATEADEWRAHTMIGKDESDPLDGVLSKAPDTIARLGMAVHAVRWAYHAATCEKPPGLPTEVDESAARAGFAVFRDFIWPSIVRTHREMETEPERVDARILARKLLSLPLEKRTDMRFWDLGRLARQFREDNIRLGTAIARLEEAGWLFKSGEGRGTVWTLNPKAAELFGGYAE
ncbi:MAG: DUF3987 domain-containing protein [Beijerinckiaceae bacterium]